MFIFLTIYTIYDDYMQAGTQGYSLSWDGQDMDGNLAPDGYYRIILYAQGEYCYYNIKKGI